MLKAGAFFLVLLLGLGIPPLSAQEEGEPGTGEDEEIPIESEWDVYMPDTYTRGDQTFIISLGLDFPTVFFNRGRLINHNFTPPLGGTGSLAYNYFFGPHFFVGGEIGGMFNYTLSESTVFIIPIGIRAGYQFVVKRFEFPLTAAIGIAPQRYLSEGYFGMFLKGGASVFFRFNPDWSFGLNSNWFWLPQWTSEPSKNVDGNMVDLTLSVRYHF
jgi:hypothetical protein